MKETEIRLRDLGVAGAIMGEQIIADLVAECEALEKRLEEAERQARCAQEDAVRHAQRKAELSDLVAASWGGKYEREVYDALHEKIAALRQRVAVLEAAAWRPVTGELGKDTEYLFWCDLDGGFPIWGHFEGIDKESVRNPDYIAQDREAWVWPVTHFMPLSRPIGGEELR